jgi:proline-specific peptidase
MSDSSDRSGFIDVPGGRVWYRVAGADASGTPLLLLHGGPGAGHDGFEPLEALADERPVVFYDQLGCGRSDIPDDPSLWHVGRFAEEVAAVRSSLGLERMHLLGSSWGGWLAIEYAVTIGGGLASLVLSSTSASSRQFLEGARRLLADLPGGIGETIERLEAEGKTDSPEYLQATMAFYKQHLCRLDPWPDSMLRSSANVAASATYGTMWGPSEFTCTGVLREWDREDDLGRITVPTLVTRGGHDEMTQDCADTLVAGIPDAELRVFENSAHMAHVEETDAYLDAVRRFLRRVDAA